MILGTASRLIPRFLKADTFETEKQHIFAKLQEHSDQNLIGECTGLTAQELRAKTPYQINTVTGRLKELRDDGFVWKVGNRKCSEMDHDRKVNEYYVPWYYDPEEVVEE
ncbi:MAG: hypothetical protein ABEK04_03435 [Candidatus Nanohalobium sp.]